jgi:hypothetical protein
MSESPSDDIPSYGMEAIISTIDNESELLDAFRIECKNQRMTLNYSNGQRLRQGNTIKRKNKNIIKLSAASNIPMD